MKHITLSINGQDITGFKKPQCVYRLLIAVIVPKGTDIAMHAADTMEAVPRFKAVGKARGLIIHPSDELDCA